MLTSGIRNLLVASLILLAACRRPPESVREPVSAFHFDAGTHDGAGRLLIWNLSGHSAVIRLRNPGLHSKLMWRVKPGITTIDSIPNGNYSLQFCLGDGWTPHAGGFDGAWFTTERACEQISYPISFEISEEADGHYTIEQFVTLRDPATRAGPMLSITRADFLGW
jgi:hypothetical protein